MSAVKEALVSNQPRQPEPVDEHWPDEYPTDEQLQEMGEYYVLSQEQAQTQQEVVRNS